MILRDGKQRRLTALVLCACMTLNCSGCAQGGDVQKGRPEDVTLIEPVGVGESYEVVRRRSLYDASVLNGFIGPEIEEYSAGANAQFEEYAVLPGSKVKKGQTIIRTRTEGLDKQIEEMEKRIAKDEEEFQEYLKENQENLVTKRWEKDSWEDVVESWEKEKPAEGTEAYEKWNSNMQYYDAQYHNALVSWQRLETSVEQRKALYALDSNYNKLLLERLKKERADCNVTASMDGVVANIQQIYKGEYLRGGPVVTVADPDRKVLKTSFVNRQDVSRAKQIFAMIDGEQYQVEYVPMDAAEYKRLKDLNDEVYTTFLLPEELADVELGTYAVVVVVKDLREDVLTVTKKAVAKGDEGNYVYVLRDGERVYTPVQTGMQDGMYVEILSGLNEGDQIVSEAEQVTGERTKTLEKGSVWFEYSKKASIAYLNQQPVSNPVKYGTVYLEEFSVSFYQQVKKGDVLAKIRVVGDENMLAREERRLLREQERLAQLRKEDEEKNAKAIKAKEETIAELLKTVEEIKADYSQTEIRSPYDGIVIGINDMYWNREGVQGELFPYQSHVASIAPQDSNFISVGNSTGLLTYGNRATVEYTAVDGTMQTAEGMVVTLNPYFVSKDMFSHRSYGQNESFALIKLPEEVSSNMAGSFLNTDVNSDSPGGWWTESTQNVKVITRKMDNVLLIPKEAVMKNGSATYVKVKHEDGSVYYQGFVAGGSDNVNYWVAKGLMEGMEICIE